jgi:hypothetical protein
MKDFSSEPRSAIWLFRRLHLKCGAKPKMADHISARYGSNQTRAHNFVVRVSLALPSGARLPAKSHNRRLSATDTPAKISRTGQQQNPYLDNATPADDGNRETP